MNEKKIIDVINKLRYCYVDLEHDYFYSEEQCPFEVDKGDKDDNYNSKHSLGICFNPRNTFGRSYTGEHLTLEKVNLQNLESTLQCILGDRYYDFIAALELALRYAYTNLRRTHYNSGHRNALHEKYLKYISYLEAKEELSKVDSYKLKVARTIEADFPPLNEKGNKEKRIEKTYRNMDYDKSSHKNVIYHSEILLIQQPGKNTGLQPIHVVMAQKVLLDFFDSLGEIHIDKSIVSFLCALPLRNSIDLSHPGFKRKAFLITAILHSCGIFSSYSTIRAFSKKKRSSFVLYPQSEIAELYTKNIFLEQFLEMTE
jgi:hypothetical protein